MLWDLLQQQLSYNAQIGAIFSFVTILAYVFFVKKINLLRLLGAAMLVGLSAGLIAPHI